MIKEIIPTTVCSMSHCSNFAKVRLIYDTLPLGIFGDVKYLTLCPECYEAIFQVEL